MFAFLTVIWCVSLDIQIFQIFAQTKKSSSEPRQISTVALKSEIRDFTRCEIANKTDWEITLELLNDFPR